MKGQGSKRRIQMPNLSRADAANTYWSSSTQSYAVAILNLEEVTREDAAFAVKAWCAIPEKVFVTLFPSLEK